VLGLQARTTAWLILFLDQQAEIEGNVVYSVKDTYQKKLKKSLSLLIRTFTVIFI
jgi:hypothetical protein